jgi:fructokinase
MASPAIICLGEALIDFTPPELGTSIITRGELKMAAGGAPANVAVGLARLGCPTGFVGKVGVDFFGQHLQKVLADNGVDTSSMRFETRANTGLAFVTWNDFAEATYLFYRNPSADTLLEPADLDEQYISQAKLLQFGSLMLATEPSASATFAALEMASKAGLLLSYDLNLRPTGWPDAEAARAAASHPLDYAHIVKLNRAELAFLTGESDPEAGAKLLWRDQFKLVVVTLDKTGSFYRTTNAHGVVPAFPAHVVDTVGAGDGFLAGLIASLWRDDFQFGETAVIERACRQAAAVGAIVVGRSGAIPALPTRDEVDRFLAGQ